MKTLAALVLSLSLGLSACGGDDPPGSTSDTPTPSESSATASATTTATTATAEILGETSRFTSETNGAGELSATVDGRECVMTDVLLGSCRASTGAGGEFLVTAESTIENPTVFNVVVRCGTDPSLPAATVTGDFLPAMTDLGLAPYGEVIGIQLYGETNEGALVYQPEGSECPIVWALGVIGDGNLFIGGTDALNGSEAPIAFTNAEGKPVCATADGSDGIAVGDCP